MRPLIASMLSLAVALAPAWADGPPEPDLAVPFGCGLSFPVSQAHNTGSHTFNDVWAWDFRMPEGTPVVAAMDGTVRMARGDSSVGGCDPRFAPYANYVVISHPGGYETQYLHFREVVVKPGDRVKAGDLLGYSGETGWACGAHLHFKLARQESSGWNNPSVPARLKGYGDPQVETVVAAPICKPPEVQMAKAEGGPSAPQPASAPSLSKAKAVQAAVGGAPAAGPARKPQPVAAVSP